MYCNDVPRFTYICRFKKKNLGLYTLLSVLFDTLSEHSVRVKSECFLDGKLYWKQAKGERYNPAGEGTIPVSDIGL